MKIPDRGGYYSRGGAYYQIYPLGGATIRGGALIRGGATIREGTVCTQFQYQALDYVHVTANLSSENSIWWFSCKCTSFKQSDLEYPNTECLHTRLFKSILDNKSSDISKEVGDKKSKSNIM